MPLQHPLMATLSVNTQRTTIDALVPLFKETPVRYEDFETTRDSVANPYMYVFPSPKKIRHFS